MSIEQQRLAEREKYIQAYSIGNYDISEPRKADALAALADLVGAEPAGDVLDVGCGSGTFMREAQKRGLVKGVAVGTEIVPDLITHVGRQPGDTMDDKEVFEAWCHDLPFEDNSFQLVTMLDVIEHLVPGDDELACKELLRVASRCILLSANNQDSCRHIGQQLHINKRPYAEWDGLFKEWFAGCQVRYQAGQHHVSPLWLIDLP